MKIEIESVSIRFLRDTTRLVVGCYYCGREYTIGSDANDYKERFQYENPRLLSDKVVYVCRGVIVFVDSVPCFLRQTHQVSQYR